MGFKLVTSYITICCTLFIFFKENVVMLETVPVPNVKVSFTAIYVRK